MRFSKKDRVEIFENAISWIVVLAMFIYGISKLIQFDGATEIDKTFSELTGMELMWAFYGYSKSFAITLGILEMIGGILILIKKTNHWLCIYINYFSKYNFTGYLFWSSFGSFESSCSLSNINFNYSVAK